MNREPGPNALMTETDIDWPRRVETWIKDEALPLWLGDGFDRETGAFEEALDFDGRPMFDLPRRVRVQARQIYTASHAALAGYSTVATSQALSALDFLSRKAWHPQGGWVHLLNRNGEVLDRKRDCYDQAFMLLALAWLYRATASDTVLAIIDDTLGALERHLGDPKGQGYLEDDRAGLPRRQNPHMHLFEAFLALHEATGDARYLERAGRCVTLFKDRFFDGKASALREYFDGDWNPAPGETGQIFEPGHHFEWVWLLWRYSAALNTAPIPQASLLLASGEAFGLDPLSGFAVDECLIGGRVLKDTMRCWPQTERLKALIAAEAMGLREWDGAVETVLSGLFGTYLATRRPGGWIDQFGPDLLPISRHMPASTLYHLYLAFTQYLVARGRLKPTL